MVWISLHLGLLFDGLGALVAVGFVGWLLKRYVFPDEKLPPAANVAIAAPTQTINVHFVSPAIPINTALTQLPNQSAPPTKSAKKQPNIVCSRCRSCKIGFDADSGTCYESFASRGITAVVATFYNTLPSSGEQVGGAIDVKARMKFYHSSRVELAEEIVYGFWLDSRSNEVDLWPEVSRDLLIAVASENTSIFLLEDRRPNMYVDGPPKELRGQSFDVSVRLTFKDEYGNTIPNDFAFVIELNSDENSKEPPIRLRLGKHH